jgi:hypothetical protein
MIRIGVRVDPQVIAGPACGCSADFLVMIVTATARSKQRGAKHFGGVWECDGWSAGPRESDIYRKSPGSGITRFRLLPGNKWR